MQAAMNVIDKVERRAFGDTRKVVAEYVAILKGEAAQEGADGRLLELGRILGFNVGAMRDHAAVLARAEELRRMLKENPRLTHLEAELWRARRKYPYLFMQPNGEPEPVEVSLRSEHLPRSINPALLTIDRAQFYTVRTLETEFELRWEILEKADLPRVSGRDVTDSLYYGAVIFHWAYSARRYLRGQLRKELQKQILYLDPRIEDIDPYALYRNVDLLKFGLHQHGHRMKWTDSQHIPGRAVLEWAKQTEESNQAIRTQLAELEAEEEAERKAEAAVSQSAAV